MMMWMGDREGMVELFRVVLSAAKAGKRESLKKKSSRDQRRPLHLGSKSQLYPMQAMVE